MNVAECHLCGSTKLEKILDLGYHPLADFFPKPHQLHEMERRYPLAVLQCGNCGHGMNSYVVPGEVRYQENDYSYDSSNSKISISHFHEMAEDVILRVGAQSGDLAVDIGSNIGTLLEGFRDRGMEVQGVDPATNVAELAVKNGIPTIADFFTPDVADAIVMSRGRAQSITITNAFNHISNLAHFMDAITKLRTETGMLVIELPYFLEILRKKHFDVVYLEHVSYIAVKPLVAFFKKYNLTILHAEENNYMSGSIRLYVGHGTSDETVEKQIEAEEQCGLYNSSVWTQFRADIEQMKIRLLGELTNVRASGGKIAAVGAAAKGNTLLNYCGIDASLVAFATDASPLKIGKYTPGSHLPILSDDAIDSSVTHALILAWNIADFLKSKISPKHPHLTFITPHVVENHTV
jgi:hypothetical protein